MEIQGIIIILSVWFFVTALSADKTFFEVFLIIPVGIGFVALIGLGISMLLNVSLAHGMATWFGVMLVMRFARVISGKTA